MLYTETEIFDNMERKMYTAGFIGIGNMGSALLTAVVKKLGSDVMVCDFDKNKVDAAVEKYGCASGSSADVAQSCRYVFICVKPQAAESALGGIVDALANRACPPVIVTIMAGVLMSRVRELCGGEYKVIRIMPNVAAAVGESMTLCTRTDNVTDDELAAFLDFMSESGKMDLIPEKLIDAGMALSGCAPAYVCMFAEALADGAVACGVPRKSAMEYAIQVLLGTAELLRESGKHPGQLKDEVTSPAGTTIAGVRALELAGFRSAATEAVIAAYEKTRGACEIDDRRFGGHLQTFSN